MANIIKNILNGLNLSEDEDDFEDEQEDDEQPEAKDCFRLYVFKSQKEA